MDKVKVAVFPCGTEVGLEVGRALRYEKHIDLIGISSKDCHGKFVYESYHSDAPWCGDVALVQYLNDLKVDYVYPTNEAAIEFIGMYFGMLTAKAVSHRVSTIELCGDKELTYLYLKDKVRVPTVYDSQTENNKEIPFPFFIKPRQGHSGIGTRIVTDFMQHWTIGPDDIAVEYLPGEEYTVDCFTQDGELLYSQARTRERITAGIAGSSRVCDIGSNFMASILNLAIPFTGAWFFQVKRSASGELCLMEIGARIAGSSALSRARGINLPLLHLYHAMGIKVTVPEPFPITEISRSLDVKAELPEEITEVVFDWDDTVSINGFINPTVMAFAWKMVKEGKKVSLLTRNTERDLFPEPFNDVIRILEKATTKAAHAHDNRLLIDDSFEERKGWKYAISPSRIDLFL